MTFGFESLDELRDSSSRLAYGVNCADKQVLCRLLGGRFMLYIDGRDRGQLPYLAMRGYCDEHLLALLPDIVKPGMVCADVGASFGYHTLLLADLVGPSGRVHAFEPNPHCFRALKSNLEINRMTSRVIPYKLAVSASNGTAELTLHKSRFGAATLNSKVKASFGPGSVESAAVSTASLDEVLSGPPVPATYLISTVGHEPAVWDGMNRILKSGDVGAVVMEFTPRWYSDAEGFAKQLFDGGFTVERLHGPGEREQLFYPRDLTKHYKQHILLTR